jgi:hypothetical protein
MGLWPLATAGGVLQDKSDSESRAKDHVRVFGGGMQ